MKTNLIVETLLYNCPSIRRVFLNLNIMSLERKISAREHKEYNHLLENFKDSKNIKIISVVGIVQTTMLISLEKTSRVHDVIIIRGNDSEVTQMGKTKITRDLIINLYWKDFLPEPFVKKIIYIDEFNSLETKGIVFSEVEKNIWTVDDPMNVEITNSRKISGKAIIKEIVDSVL